MSALTQAERDTLNAAEQILIKHLIASKESLMISLHHGWKAMELSYFTPSGAQHTWVEDFDDATFAGKISKALAIRADEDGRADQIKAQRIAKLKAELASLDAAA